MMTEPVHFDQPIARSHFRGSHFGVSPGVKALIFAVVLAIIICTPTAAQDESDKVFKVDTDLAVFEVTVTDKNGKPMRGLTASDFRVMEDGIERPIDFFQPIERRTNAGRCRSFLPLDVSGSMTSEERHAEERDAVVHRPACGLRFVLFDRYVRDGRKDSAVVHQSAGQAEKRIRETRP